MENFLLLGLLVGMAHAFESDHLAAVGTMAADGKTTPKRLAFLGASWGMGHATTLFLVSLPIILFGVILTDKMAAGLEFAIGVLLVGLGAQVFYKLWRARVHFHAHQHGDGQRHFHAHSHANDTMAHRKNPHHHEHSAFSWRAYLIGLAHGAAGSAGLVALAAAATQSAVTALAYVLLFGVGSIFGMAALTYAASWPLRLAEKTASRLLITVQLATAVVAISVGVLVMLEAAPIIRGLV
ncbi:MAG TPA: high frequency lysogenization protein HflD [Rhodobacteraceae bacterium]|jgi:high-affinity nickel permease|nr:high frequency lysogenization protein HflD [Paracoccaceae bacterium]